MVSLLVAAILLSALLEPACRRRSSLALEIEEHADCPDGHCKNNGTCLKPVDRGSFICRCPEKFWGSRCQHQIGDRPCVGNLCRNGAICDSDGSIVYDDLEYNYGCRCTKQFSGPFCNVSRRELMCREQQRCNDRSEVAVKDNQCYCQCKPHYTGADCEVELPCAKISCLHGGVCINGVCDCSKTLYMGPRCDQINYDVLPENSKELCKGTKDLKCANGAVCTVAKIQNKEPFAFCNCSVNWSGDQLCTKPFDPCKVSSFEKTCSENPAACGLRKPASKSRCHHDGKCVSVVGTSARSHLSFKCQCTEKYIGQFCETKNPCRRAFSCPTKHHKCVLTSGADGFTVEKMCLCNENYTGPFCNRRVTETVLERVCRSHKCQNNSTCVPCLKIPGLCKTVEQQKRKYICSCDQRQSGEFCEHQLDPCRFHECRNKASCVKETAYSYRCQCSAGVTGLHCEIILDICSLRTPCLHGFCFLTKHTEHGFRCECPDGKYGFQCELDYYAPWNVLYTTRTGYITFWVSLASLLLALGLFVHTNLLLVSRGPGQPTKKKTTKRRRQRWQSEWDENESDNLSASLASDDSSASAAKSHSQTSSSESSAAASSTHKSSASDSTQSTDS